MNVSLVYPLLYKERAVADPNKQYLATYRAGIYCNSPQRKWACCSDNRQGFVAEEK